MDLAIIIAIILAGCVIFALGVYHGQHHAREQRERLFADLTQALDLLDDLGEMYDQHATAAHRDAIAMIPGAIMRAVTYAPITPDAHRRYGCTAGTCDVVYDNERSGL